MNKLLSILISVFFCQASIFCAHAESTVQNKFNTSTSNQLIKDTVGMDALVDSLQQEGLIKLDFSDRKNSKQSNDTSYLSMPSTEIAIETPEGSNEVDLQMLIAGLVLIGVIAFRRML